VRALAIETETGVGGSQTGLRSVLTARKAETAGTARRRLLRTEMGWGGKCILVGGERALVV